MLRSLVPAVLALLVGAVAPPSRAGVDPNRRWFTLTTAHFAVHSYDGGEAIAREVAAYSEEARETLTPLLGWAPKERVHVVVTNEVDSANGFAAVMPYGVITLWAWPPEAESELGDYANWLKLLVFHEYTHIAHLDHATGVPAWANLLFGRVFKPNQALPRWVTEGIAVWVESTQTGGGRVGSSRMEMLMRTAALANRLPGLGDLTGSPLEHPRGTMWYMFGGYVFARIAAERGDAAVERFVSAYGRRVIPYAVNQVAREATGQGLDAWFEAVKDDVRAQAEAVRARVESAGRLEGEAFTRGGEHKFAPRFSPDGESLAWIHGDGHRPAHLVLAPARALEAPVDLVRCEGGCGDFAWSKDGQQLVYGTSRHHRHVNVYGELAEVAARPGAPRRSPRALATARRAHQPTADADGQRYWYVAAAWGRTWLEAVDRTSGEVVATLRPPADDARLDHPAAHPNGRDLYVVMHAGGSRDLYRVDLTSGAFTPLTAGRATELDPVVTADGRWLVYSADLDGVYDIYARELGSGETRRLTRVLGGAFDPAVSPDGQTLVYSGWTVDGFELFRLPFAPDAAPLAPVEARAPLAPEAPRPTPMTRSAYQALPTLLPRRWLPSWVADSTGLSRLGLAIDGADLANLWAAALALEWDFARDDFSASASATLRLGYPDLTLSAGRYTWDRVAYAGDRATDYREEVLFGAFGLSLSLPSVFTGLGFGMGYTLDVARGFTVDEWSHAPDSYTPFVPAEGVNASLNLWWSLSDVQAYAFSISPQLGGALSMNLRLRDPLLGSTSSSYTLTGVARAYLPMPADDHVLALRLEAGASGGESDARSRFGLGGVPAQDLVTDLLNQTSAGSVWLRGFPVDAFSGTAYGLLTAEYRLPLWRARGGLDTLPVFLEDVSLSLFADGALLGDEPFAGAFFDTPHLGLGLELRWTLDLFYGYAAAFRLGYARGLGVDGIDQVYLLMAPPP